MTIERIWEDYADAETFSGVFSFRDEQGIIFEKCQGYRYRAEQLPNNTDTAFGIASGTKLFTGLAVCKLIDEGCLSLRDKLWDLLPYDLGEISKDVEIFHLLTHTSGIGDYIDEEAPDFREMEEELCRKYPLYLWERLEYYLQMITPLPAKFKPGERFAYSNAGFIMLGLIIEAVSGLPYQQFVTEQLIWPLQLKHTGFYRTDNLPANTAIGYYGEDVSDQHANMFKLPIIGGADGGLYTCAEDLDTLWRTVFAGNVLSENMLQEFLKQQVVRSSDSGYGLGVYRKDAGKEIVYYAVGGDFGVDFFTAYFPSQKLTASALGNTEVNTFPLLRKMFEEIS